MAILIIFLLVVMAVAGFLTGPAIWRKIAGYESRPTGQNALPGLSVVAYVQRDEDHLDEYVDTLLSQDYPDFEVILVCDASAEATAMISGRFENVDNLHLTFIPPGSHNLSRRKLAQTLGIKRAVKEVVVTTSTSVMPRSDKWLRSLAEPFADSEINIVCGYVHPVFNDFTGPAKWYRQMDSILTSAQWMDEAVKGSPYRGDGYNLAFRRSLFFDVKGYSASITLMDGDDDIFINEISNGADGCLVLNHDSFVDTRWGAVANRMYVDYKDRYRFTRRYLPKAPFLRSALLSWANWILLLGAVWACAMIGIAVPAVAAGNWTPEIIPLLSVGCAALLIILIFWLIEIFAYRRLASRLEAVRLFWAVIPFLLWRPIGNFLFFLNHYPSRKSHYTWVRN